MEVALNIRLEQTYKKEHKNLLNFIKSKIAPVEEAEDILQDVFFQVVQSPNVIESVDNLIGWLYTVARNKIIDWYRRKRHKTVSLDETNKDISIYDLLKNSGINIEKDFVRSLVTEAIIKSLDELPDSQRDVFIMQAVEGKTFREISEMTGTTINTLIARKHYAVLFLRKRLKDIKDIINEIK